MPCRTVAQGAIDGVHAKASAQKGPTAKDLRAADRRVGEAILRIAGAGALAFADKADVRAKFEGLAPSRSRHA